MKVTMTEALCQEGMDLLQGKTEIFVAHDANPHHYTEQLKDTDALIVRVADKGAIDESSMKTSPNLKVIGRTGIGYDSVDVAAATKLGIPVVITPGANNRSVAEHVVTLMLALSKNLVEADVEQRKGNWKIRDAHKAFEVEHKTCLLIGLGTIGKIISRLCLGLDMKVIGYDTFLSGEQMAELGVEKYDDKFEALKAADVVIVQMPLIEGVTNNTIAKAELEAMKPTALLINCGRGELVNEPDLCAALKSGEIAGAGLDVFWNEPTRVDDEIVHCPNVIVSPHSAAQTREAVIKMATMCVEGCLAVCNGKKWPYVADKKVYDHPRWAGKDWAEV
ncbi:MAG: hydroxyacid dehydrogenase [Clostridiales bacterium]|nr:hydroxyacid dehydrogenase [Clostridiales bacterium]